MTETSAVAIVGAGPYGLSIAAHLTAHGVKPLVFGAPMNSWQNGMPQGMRLKSDGFASCLSDPCGVFTLKAFCTEQGLPYADVNVPVPVETFVVYGQAFQKRFVPQLDPRTVHHIARTPRGFSLQLEDGTPVEVRRVILATGIGAYKHIPAVLAGLERVTHTCDHSDYSRFAKSRVVVVGAGASAVDAVAALKRAGAEVSLISRSTAVRFYPGGKPRTMLDRIIAPSTPLGPGWKKLLCVKAPVLFRLLPAGLRIAIVKRYLGPAPGYAVRDEVEGKVKTYLASAITGARETGNSLVLDVVSEGRSISIEASHVIAGTGFSVDVKRLGFLAPEITNGLALTGTAPKLSSRFESSVPGLYFAGTAAAFEFGPMLRFVCGAEFAAKRVASHVAALERRRTLRKPEGTPVFVRKALPPLIETTGAPEGL